jgi:hypothetical protein
MVVYDTTGEVVVALTEPEAELVEVELMELD